MPDSTVTFNPNVIVPPERKDKLTHALLDEIDAAMKAKVDLDAKIVEWNNLYEGVKPPKSTPWKNCSNLHIPLTAWQIDTTKSHIGRTVFGTEPTTRIDPREEGDPGTAKELQNRLQYWEERLAVPAKGDMLALRALKHGTSIAKVTQHQWENAYRGTRIDDQGNEIVEDKIIARSGARVDLVPIRDFVIAPAESMTVKEATLVGDRKWLRLAEVRKRERAGFYLKGTGDKIEKGGEQASQGQTETQEATGISPNQSISKPFLRYERWECIVSLPLKRGKRGFIYDPDKGEEIDCLVTIFTNGPTLARVILYPWFHQRRHYIPFRVLPRDDSFWGRSACELLHDLNDELDTEHNQRADWRSLLLNRPMIRVRGARITDQTGRNQITFGPNVVLDVNESKDLSWMEMPPTPSDSAAEEQRIVEYAERVLSVTQVRTGGVAPGSQTLGEVDLAQAQGDVRFEDMVAAFQGYSDFQGGDFQEGAGMRELAYQLIGLDLQFSDPGTVFQILGERFQRTELSLEDAMEGYDYIPQGNTITSNQNTQRNEAILMYRELMRNPLVTLNGKNLWNATNMLLDAFDRRDAKTIIGEPEEAQQAIQQQIAEQQSRAGRTQGGGGAGEGAAVNPLVQEIMGAAGQ